MPTLRQGSRPRESCYRRDKGFLHSPHSTKTTIIFYGECYQRGQFIFGLVSWRFMPSQPPPLLSKHAWVHLPSTSDKHQQARSGPSAGDGALSPRKAGSSKSSASAGVSYPRSRCCPGSASAPSRSPIPSGAQPWRAKSDRHKRTQGRVGLRRVCRTANARLAASTGTPQARTRC